jgi:alpha-tubulin suppressor-like RCC1 family protein
MRSSPVEVTALRNVKIAQIACSYSHTVVLTDTGKVFVWGSSTTSYGALGFGDDIVQTPYPKHLEMLDKMQIRRIFCGKSSCFTFALTAHGDMYAWGQNTSGQLGFGDTKRRSKPQLSDKIRRIAHMATGLAQVIAVDTEGLMFSWGGNRYGLLGYDTNSEDQLLPREITSMRRKDIIKVECTDTLVFALSRSGQVYVWGKMDLASTLKQELTKISVTNITCGRHHVIFTTDDGTLYGYDPFGNSAIPRPQQDQGLTKLNVKYKHVIAGDSFTFMLTD